ncbi:zinc ribbon domain-containing protein [Geobacillus thermodenitrificans]|uniref:zinc ribbon domain-containing protein n=1 Tax=Geobacillus thermodenitrificans TaxID=33940 RepID=UPI002E1BF562
MSAARFHRVNGARGCGHWQVEVKSFNIRSRACRNCGVERDRDHNAARNILQEGLRLQLLNCGTHRDGLVNRLP